MSAAGAAEGSVAVTPALERVQELDRRERDAIARGDWDALDGILESQKALWRELVSGAGAQDDATGALAALYEVRRRNHALIERSLLEMRRKLTTAHAGTGARMSYHRTSRRAA